MQISCKVTTQLLYNYWDVHVCIIMNILIIFTYFSDKQVCLLTISLTRNGQIFLSLGRVGAELQPWFPHSSFLSLLEFCFCVLAWLSISIKGLALKICWLCSPSDSFIFLVFNFIVPAFLPFSTIAARLQPWPVIFAKLCLGHALASYCGVRGTTLFHQEKWQLFFVYSIKIFLV